MVTNREHPHNEFSKEELEKEIQKIIDEFYRDYFDNLSYELKTIWEKVLVEARFGENREIAFNNLSDFVNNAKIEVGKLKDQKDTEK